MSTQLWNATWLQLHDECVKLQVQLETEKARAERAETSYVELFDTMNEHDPDALYAKYIAMPEVK